MHFWKITFPRTSTLHKEKNQNKVTIKPDSNNLKIKNRLSDLLDLAAFFQISTNILISNEGYT